MSCGRIPEAHLSALVDGELGRTEEKAVRSHLTECAACRGEVADLEQVAALVGEDVAPLPGADAWEGFERGLREGVGSEPVPLDAGDPRGRWVLAAAVAAVVLLAFRLSFWLTDPQVVVAAQRLPNPSLSYAAPEWRPGPSGELPPLADVVDGGLAGDIAGSDSAVAALASHGLVQVPAGTARLADLYPLDPPAGAPAPLATADASLVLYGAAAARAALTVERELIAPATRDVLALATRELGTFAERASGPTALAAARVRDLVAVAAVLEGAAPVLPADAEARVQEEVARVRAAEGAAPSALLRREVDYTAFRPRGIFAEDPALADHARAIAWLGQRGIRFAGEGTRSASLVALGLAHGALPDGRAGLAAFARLEAAIEVLYGPPDGLAVFDVLTCLRQALGRRVVRLGDLNDQAAPDRLHERSLAVAEARGLELVRPAPRPRAEGEADESAVARAAARGPRAPVFHLLGATRTLEGMAFTRLSHPRVPRRPQPTSLDLLVLLGSRRARTAVSALGLDVSGYDTALEELRGATRPWRDPSLPVPVRTSLEQARLWSLAALFGPREESAAPFQNAPRYRSRLLLVGLTGLNGPAPAPARPPGPPEPGPVPLVEPLPRLHARLAFSARRLLAVLAHLGLERGPRTVAAYGALERVAVLEEALRDASLDTLAGRPLPPETRSILAGYAATVRDLAPSTVHSAEDVFVYSDGVVLHRLVHRLDRLVAVAHDPARGRPRLAVGAALLGCEVGGIRGRLTPAEVADHPRVRTPAWADHVRAD